jgi:membrane protein YdbS with pleckstrin-like domain
MPVVACPDCAKDVSTIAPVCPHCGRPSPAGTAPVTSPPAPAREETLWRGTPSAKLLLGKIFVTMAILVLIYAIAWLIGFLAQPADIEQSATISRIAWVAAGIVIVIQAVVAFIALIKLRSTLYTVTNQRVMIETGLFSKHLGEIDLRLVDDTVFTQRFIQRMLGIGDVTMLSNDPTTPVQTLRGVNDPRSLRELIRSHAYQVSQRQIFTRAT